MININSQIAKEIKISENQVESVVSLLDEGATIPFIARYRKEKTNGLDEEFLRSVSERYDYFTTLNERKKTILNSIREQGKLTPELENKINKALKTQEIEDLYLPYKQKRKTRATIAKEKGLEPLVLLIINHPKFQGSIYQEYKKYINAELDVNTEDDVIKGVSDIIAELISEDISVRSFVRKFIFDEGMISTKKVTSKVVRKGNAKDVYDIYHEFSAPVNKIKNHQLLAINRGEKEKFLKLNIDFDKDYLVKKITQIYLNYQRSVFNQLITDIATDSLKRLLEPSIERDIRKELTEIAEKSASEVFASNLKQLLLQSPINNKMIMGIDPGFVSGSKIAIIDPTGKYLAGETMYPHPPQNRKDQSKKIVLDFIKKYKVDLIAIGNGTASRETEVFVADLIKQEKLDCNYLIVNEAGASVYSASPIAKQEFPDLDASQRGNISIARRVLDPLAELVKIDPKSIGVGQYQHDIDQKLLDEKLSSVVESCVNYVGVDINTASSSLLNHVSGLNKKTANNIITHREKIGTFKNRKEILSVAGLGKKTYEQAAGFLKISSGENPLDNTFIHPESYKPTEKLLGKCNISKEAIKNEINKLDLYLKKEGVNKIAEELGIGTPTLNDIIENLKKPGRDPRQELSKPILRTDVLTIENLKEDMVLDGTVRNIVDFGAFVDIGLKNDALLHISQIVNRFIKHPLEVLSVGDIVKVKVISLDLNKNKVSISMKDI